MTDLKLIDQSDHVAVVQKAIGRLDKTVWVCTAASPWPGDEKHNGPVRHVGAHEVGEQEAGWPGGDIVSMRCPHCEATWHEELPQ